MSYASAAGCYGYDSGSANIDLGVVMAPGDMDGQWAVCAFPGYLVTLNDASRFRERLRVTIQALGWRNHPGADPDTQYNWWYEGSPVNFKSCG